MAEQIVLEVEKRVKMGKAGSKALRKEGYVPGIYYTKTGENIPVKVRQVPLGKLFHKVGSSHVFQLKIENEEKPSFIWQIQHHPYKNQIEHVDFYGVDLTKRVRVAVPVQIEGRAKGKEEGGVVEIFRDTIELECLPLDIPETILIDVTELGVGDSINIEDIKLAEGVDLIHEEGTENFAVVGVVVPSAMEEPETEEAEGEEAMGEETEGEEAEGESEESE